MKKLGLFLITSLAAVFFAACNDSDGDYASQWAFVSVSPLANNDYYFRLDDGKTVYPGDKSRTGAYNAKADQRAIIFFNYLKDAAEGYDYNVALYGVQNIYSGETRTVSTETEVKELPTDRTSFVGAKLNDNYLNLGIGFNASDLEKHCFLLVENTFTQIASENKEEGYLNLELRHDADGDTSGYDYMDRYVSFRFGDDFKALLKDKKGIILRVSTRLNGDQYIKIELYRAK